MKYLKFPLVACHIHYYNYKQQFLIMHTLIYGIKLGNMDIHFIFINLFIYYPSYLFVIN